MDVPDPPISAEIAISAATRFIAAGGLDPYHRLDGPSDFGVVRLYRCEICASLDALLVLARARVTRQLSPSERELYLNETAAPTKSAP